MGDRKLLGRWGEERAAEYLRGKKYKIDGMNWSCRMGEIDVIASDKHYIVFCEVKLRRSADFAQAREFVTPAKQRRVITAAQLWLQQNETKLQPRFDVIEVYAPQGMQTERPTINHLENAFTLED